MPEDRRVKELFERTVSRYSINRILLLHPFYYAVGALDAAKVRSVPVSTYFHGFELRSQLRNKYPADHVGLVRDRRVGTLRERVFYTIGASDEVLVNSRYTASLFEGFDAVPPVRATGCGIPEAALVRECHATPHYDAASRRAHRVRMGLPAQTCLAFVGRLVRTKGIERILRLCRADADLGAVIVGTGPDEERLRGLVKSWKLQERVVFAGRVNESEKWLTLRGADFLCLLSEPDEAKGQVEGFGIALLEGAAAGAVPVSSGTGGMVDVVTDGKTGLILDGTDRADARRLSGLARDERRMRGLVDRAREQLRQRYNWIRVAERMVAEW